MWRTLLHSARRLLPARSPAASAPASLPTPPPKLSEQQLDALMRDFARRYHSAPPYAAVGVKVPPGWNIRGFTAEALRRYPNQEACR